jgi:hypothetical protein
MSFQSNLTFQKVKEWTGTSSETGPKKDPSIPKDVSPLVQARLSPTTVDQIKKSSLQIKKEDKPNSSVTKVFGKSLPRPKNSIGGKSLNPSASLHSTHSTKSKKRKKSPRQGPLSLSSKNVDLSQTTPTVQALQNMSKELFIFAAAYQEKLVSLNLEKQVTEKEKGEWESHEHEIAQLAQQLLVEEIGPKWKILRRDMEAIFNPQNLETEEESRLLSRIDFENLGIEQQLTPTSHTKKESLKQTFHGAKKKGEEKHLEATREFFIDYFLELTVENPFLSKSNIRKMNQFSSVDENKTQALVFNYIENLMLFGDTLKLLAANKDLKIGGDHSTLTAAKKYVKTITELKDIKGLPSRQKNQAIAQCCEECGDCIILYAKLLAKRLAKLVEDQDKSQSLSCFFSGSMEDSIGKIIDVSGCKTFAADIRRTILAKYLSISTDNKNIPVPSISKKVRKEGSDEYKQFYHDLLTFFMQNLGIDPTSNKKCFDPLEVLKDKNYDLQMVYNELEAQWNEELNKKGTKTKPEGVFKLLPILRMFNQAILMTPQIGILSIEKLIAERNNQIIRDLPCASSSKNRLPGQRLDRETKSMQIEFKNDKVFLTVKRKGALENPPSSTEIPVDKSKQLFDNCIMEATVEMSGSIKDMTNWDVKTFVEIERPKIENSNPIFSSRFAALMTTLEIMGMSYTVKDV